jgi:hypothetical protein
MAVPLALYSAERGTAPEGVTLVEAEAFAQHGGWVLDQQFMDQMGSPFLLAHGLGKPVQDAVTSVSFPETGEYRLWVRTRDWVAPWKMPDTPASKRAEGTPGIFKLIVDGKTLDATFGNEGAEWHWQDGGTVKIGKKEVSIALHDLTGFEGRCDALLFVKDKGMVPPNGEKELAQFRAKVKGLPEKPTDAGEYDLVVVGGGIAGIGAAVAAARNDVKVALIQDRPVLGGNNSSEVRVWLGGKADNPLYPNVGKITRALEPTRRAHDSTTNSGDLYEDSKREAFVRAEKNISLFLSHRVNSVEAGDGKIKAVIAEDIITGERRRFGGKLFADCTGDGCVGFLAGADYEATEKGHMGQSNLWNIKDTGSPVSFPRCPWAYNLSEKPFPGKDAQKLGSQLGTWFWESGCYRDPIKDRERARDNNFRAMYGAWDCLKNVDKKLPNHELVWAAYISGPRESRRLLGDIVLNKDHLMNGEQFNDRCVITGWEIDLHLPNEKYKNGFEGDEFITTAMFTRYPKPFYVPYRCFYSRNISNLFMAGRDISVTHEALGTVRVMRTCGLMGEVVGMAASVCRKHDVTPRAVYEKYLGELEDLMGKALRKDPGVASEGASGSKSAFSTAIAVPAWLSKAGPNLARTAEVSAPAGSREDCPPALINDGKMDVRSNKGRWLSSGKPPHSVEFAWKEPVTIGAARIISGYYDTSVSGAISDFALQWHDGSDWKDIDTASVKDNMDPYWSCTFPAVKTAKIRICIKKTKGDISRLWEVELYGPVSQ